MYGIIGNDCACSEIISVPFRLWWKESGKISSPHLAIEREAASFLLNIW
jgi:hypothetical protein